MKLGVFTVPLYDRSFEEACKYLSGLGVQVLEVGVGGYPGKVHLDPKNLLGNPEKIQEYKDILKKYNLEIAAFSCHSNPVSPNKEQAAQAHEDFIDACKIAKEFDIDTIVTFSGCPGDYENAKFPNWVTCAWPPEYGEILKYQWDEVLIPYWKKAVKIAEEYGVTKIALEMHPGFCVYNPTTLLKLREAVGPIIGVNFDPSHLYWQGIKPSEAIKALKGSIYHFHAKDTKIDEANKNIKGVLDSTNYGDIANRSWVFRSVGYGHDNNEWKEIISTLMAIGYDGAISVEHEDGLMSITEGLEKAITCLKECMIFEKPSDMWWA